MIRAYVKSDWESVCKIYNRSKPDEMKGIVCTEAITPLECDQQMLDYFNNSRIQVYEHCGQILGFIGQKDDVVSWLFVHPDHRRKGIAKKLLKNLIHTWDGPLTLNLTKTNHVAMSLYQNLGFIVLKEFEGKMYGKRIPAVKMILENNKLK